MGAPRGPQSGRTNIRFLASMLQKRHFQSQSLRQMYWGSQAKVIPSTVGKFQGKKIEPRKVIVYWTGRLQQGGRVNFIRRVTSGEKKGGNKVGETRGAQ